MEWILRWCEWYTRGLPPDVVRDRLDEITSDLHEHETDLGFDYVDPLRWRQLIVSRAIRGVPADLAWRESKLRRVEAMRLGLAPTREVVVTMRIVAGIAILGIVAGATGAVALMRDIAIGAPSGGLTAVTTVLIAALIVFVRPTTRLAGAGGMSIAIIALGWLIADSPVGALALLPVSVGITGAAVLITRLRRR
jgi:hypothetical protein